MNTHDTLKTICKYIFIAGGGNYWDEDLGREKLHFKIYAFITHVMIVILVILQVMAATIGDMPEELKNVARTFGLSHIIVFFKLMVIAYNKSLVKKLNIDMIEACKQYEMDVIFEKQFRTIKINVYVLIIMIYGTVVSSLIQGWYNNYMDDVPFVTLVTYWPNHDDLSIYAVMMRVAATLEWIWCMAVMMPVESLVISHVIILRYKFLTLQLHFEGLIGYKNISSKEPIDDLKQGFLEGIKMHQDLLRLFVAINDAFGLAISAHVLLMSYSSVLMLLQTALMPKLTIATVSTSIIFISTLSIMLGQYLWNAGDLTHQASLLSESIFHCGWHLAALQRPAHSDVRQLVLLSSACAQRPLVIKAFGVMDLSYATYVSIIKTSYSVFAVLRRSHP